MTHWALQPTTVANVQKMAAMRYRRTPREARLILAQSACSPGYFDDGTGAGCTPCDFPGGQCYNPPPCDTTNIFSPCWIPPTDPYADPPPSDPAYYDPTYDPVRENIVATANADHFIASSTLYPPGEALTTASGILNNSSTYTSFDAYRGDPVAQSDPTLQSASVVITNDVVAASGADQGGCAPISDFIDILTFGQAAMTVLCFFGQGEACAAALAFTVGLAFAKHELASCQQNAK